MTEPIYEYVKGQGWLIVTYPTVRFVDGKNYKVVPRKPKIGEYYSYNTGDNNHYTNEDGTPNLKNFASYWAGSCPYKADEHTLVGREDVTAWVTFEPV